MSNNIRARNRRPLNLEGGLKIDGVDIVAVIDSLLKNYTTLSPQRFVGNSITASFTLNPAPTFNTLAWAFINGVYQQKNTYSITNGNIVFTEPPPEPIIPGEENIEVIIIHTLALTGMQDSILELSNLVNQKNTANGYPGLSNNKLNFRNLIGTFISFLTNANTAIRTYTFKDRDGVIADDTDVTNLSQATAAISSAHADLVNTVGNLAITVNGKAPTASPTFTGAVSVPTLLDTDDSNKAAPTSFVKNISIGAKAVWSDMSASRLLDTAYVNSLNRPIQVNVSCAGSNSGAQSTITAKVGVVTPDITVGISGTSEAGPAWVSINNTLSFIVPPGNSYAVFQSAGSSTIAAWAELK